MRFRASFWYFI